MEWIGPYADSLLGLLDQKHDKMLFPYYYFPGWHSATGVEELLIHDDCLEDIKNKPHLKSIIEDAAAYAHQYISNQFEIKNILTDYAATGNETNEREIKVHYSIFDDKGNQLGGNIASVRFPASCNKTEEITKNTFRFYRKLFLPT